MRYCSYICRAYVDIIWISKYLSVCRLACFCGMIGFKASQVLIAEMIGSEIEVYYLFIYLFIL